MFTPEELEEMKKRMHNERDERNRRLDELRRNELESKGIKPFDESQVPQKYCDHPNTMENSTATVVWIVVMLIGSIFKGNWVIWIIATVIWAKFITRHDK
jgi:hypothetical protein